MAHNHGLEYQIRIVCENGREELSGWLSSTEQVTKTVLAVQGRRGTTCWLMVRSVSCPDCSDGERTMEFPFAHVPSSRYVPHDSRYLLGGHSTYRRGLDSSAARYAR
jgi:hypothetical protein